MADGNNLLQSYKAKQLLNSYGSSTLPIYFDNGVAKSISSYEGNSATATKLFSSGTTAQVWRGDNIWSNSLLGTSTNLESPIFTIENTSSGEWMPSLHQLAPNMIQGQYITSFIGKNKTTKNSAHLSFYYDGNESDNNRFNIGFYNNTNLLVIKNNGNVGIGTTNPTNKLYINGGTYPLAINVSTGESSMIFKVGDIMKACFGSYSNGAFMYNAGSGNNVHLADDSIFYIPYQLNVASGNARLGRGLVATNRASLILNSASNNAGEIVFHANSTAISTYGNWSISSRNGESGDWGLSIWRGAENGLIKSEKRLFDFHPYGTFSIFPDNSANNYNEGIRLHSPSDNYCGVILCGSDNTGDTGTSSKTWSIFNYNGNFHLRKNGSSVNGLASFSNVDNTTWRLNDSNNDGALIIGKTSGTPNVASARKLRLGLATAGHTGSQYWTFCIDDTTADSYLQIAYTINDTGLSLRHDGYLGIGTRTPSYKLHVIGNSYFNGNIISPSDYGLVQNQANTSNYTSAIRWFKNSTGWSGYTYQPQIGQYNFGGDGTGSITIVPYPTNTSPWDGSVGLYIRRGQAFLDGTQIITNSGTWGISINGNAAMAKHLPNGFAFAHGVADKPWYQVASFSQSVSGQQINTSIVFLVSSFYSPQSKGILEVSCRMEANATSPSWVYCRWLVADTRINPNLFIATWSYSSSIVTLKLYVNTTGWTSYNFIRLTEHDWGVVTDKWIMGQVHNGTVSSIPSNENQIISSLDSIKNNAATASQVNVNNDTSSTIYVIGATGTGNQSLYRESSVYITGNTLRGAAWNDYAEYRERNKTKESSWKPGTCLKEDGDGKLSPTTKRLERGCEIISDTFGFAIGETEKCDIPIAASGRVLAYPYESRIEFASHIGWPVCSGPNGTVSIMTEEEEEKYPSRIIGTISEIPTYEKWGTGNVKVDGRVWIRIR